MHAKFPSTGKKLFPGNCTRRRFLSNTSQSLFVKEEGLPHFSSKITLGVAKKRAKNNRTTFVRKSEIPALKKRVISAASLTRKNFLGATILGKIEDIAPLLPSEFVNLLFLDPPYNLSKKFGSSQFKAQGREEYEKTFEDWILLVKHTLRTDASIYVCCDWQTSPIVYDVLQRHFVVRNRITWEREKGRGSRSNWKNCSEDIWFATVSRDYYFDADAVKLKKKVLAPYKEDGKAKDWSEEKRGKFRLTYPSNLWTDITIPFWSMPENTDHPTQKPEKLLAKIMLASTEPGDVVLDPFLGSGTTSVVASKLGRKYVGIEMDPMFCYLAEKRIIAAQKNQEIQGYADGFFWERNSLGDQKKP